jgi:hypothetical protein
MEVYMRKSLLTAGLTFLLCNTAFGKYEHGVKIGTTPSGVKENSGMAYSETYKRFYYINDGGNGNYLFVSTMKGSLLDKVKVKGSRNRDWEGLAYGPCGDKKCIYIGDIGDNSESRPYHDIYVVKEREYYGSKVNIDNKIRYSYADGDRPNAESIAIHPISGDLFIASKEYGKGTTVIYRIKYADFNGKSSPEVKAYPVAKIRYKALKNISQEKGYTAAMSISPSGEKFLLITAQSYHAWEFNIDLSKTNTFTMEDAKTNFKAIPVDYLGQEESVEYLTENEFIYSSEGRNAAIIQVSTK